MRNNPLRSAGAGAVLCLRGTVLCLLGTVLCVLGSVPGTMLVGSMLIPALGAETYPALEIIQRERKLQKRAKRALEHALNTVSGVAAAYESGRRGRGAALLMEIQAVKRLLSLELCLYFGLCTFLNSFYYLGRKPSSLVRITCIKNIMCTKVDIAACFVDELSDCFTPRTLFQFLKNIYMIN